MKIEWEEIKPGKSFYAKVNGRIIALVTERFDGAIAWEITAVRTKWICAGHGLTRSIKLAKANVRRNWKAWVEAHGLGPPP